MFLGYPSVNKVTKFVLFRGGISMKLATSIRHVNGKVFNGRGQSQGRETPL